MTLSRFVALCVSLTRKVSPLQVLRPVGAARNDSSVFKAGTDYTVVPATANVSAMGRPGEVTFAIL